VNGVIYFRADHDLIGRVLAEKLRRRADRDRLDDSFRILDPKPASASMPSETRRVLIAAGHYVSARRATRAPVRNGKVLLVVNSHRPPIEVDEARWNAAEVVRG
jgi:hypothetical protein